MGSVKRVPNFMLRVIKKSDMANTIRILGNSFMTEPILAHSDITKQENEKFVSLQSDVILSDDLTFIGETKEGEPAGVSMSLDFATKPPKAFGNYVKEHRHFSAVQGLLAHLEDHYCRLHGFTRDTLPPNHSVHMFMLGVEPAFRNKGLGSALRGAALQHYKQKGYRFAMAEASSLYIRKICIKFGFETVLRVPFEEWFPEDSIYSRGTLDGHDAMHLMVKELK